VTLEIGGPGYVAAGDGWEETIIWDFIPAFWKKADPKPFEARLFASTPGIMIIVVLSSRDPGLDWPDLKAFQERVATDMWGNLS
ncbi:MAG TPA: hypothetical protein PK890_05300, partial [Terrimesophilobacter sp.]|nr:hypothetical protein [Terrimesophilobacter sp.]